MDASNAPAPDAPAPDTATSDTAAPDTAEAPGPPAASPDLSAETAAESWSLHAAWAAPIRGHPVPVALLCVAVLTLIAWRIGLRPDLPAFLWLGLAGSLLGVVDATLKRLPEPLTLPSYAAGVLLIGAAASFTADGGDRFRHALYGMAALGAFFGVQWLLLPAGAYGFGDVTLAGLLGMHLGWLGWDAWILGVAATSAFTLAVVLALLVTRRGGRKTQIPYGPLLLAGTLVAILVHGS
ncbi:prepilin peptidase [Actinomadura macra]|uniref:prepilin peptidase n=1 Tax=Actinomadura macra TaxID=46164 RepID=UPI000A00BEEB|nr:A24 family peptidase [Actinomadura macra]